MGNAPSSGARKTNVNLPNGQLALRHANATSFAEAG
jgi:hypothetical protein